MAEVRQAGPYLELLTGRGYRDLRHDLRLSSGKCHGLRLERNRGPCLSSGYPFLQGPGRTEGEVAHRGGDRQEKGTDGRIHMEAQPYLGQPDS